MKVVFGCLAVIGAAVVLGIILVTCSVANVANTHAPASTTRNSSNGSVSSDCERAVKYSNQAFSDFKASDYNGGYKNAKSAESLAASCSDGGPYDMTMGFALSAKALNEHYLTEGDSKTDFNQAEQLLASCQTDVGFYGTHNGALCATQEQNDISTEDNWELNQ